MIEQHIDPTDAVSYDKFFPPANKRESGAEFQEKPRNILFKSSFKLFFLIIDWDSYKSKVIIILSDFLRHTALSLRKVFTEVTDCFAARFIESGFQ